jgi:ABC-type multidrug transport system fused ATPase/permease subunit
VTSWPMLGASPTDGRLMHPDGLWTPASAALGWCWRLEGERLIRTARREHLAPGQVADSHDLLRIASAENLKARLSRSSVKRIQALSLPVIARHRDGTYSFAHTTSRMDAILGSLLFQHLIALPIAYFESRATGQTVARVRELENVLQFMTSSALTLVIDVVFGLLFLVVMFWYSPQLTLVVVISIPFYAVISLFMTPILKARAQEKFQRGAANQPMLVESLAGIQTIKATAVEPQVRRRWDEQLAGYIAASLDVEVKLEAFPFTRYGRVRKTRRPARWRRWRRRHSPARHRRSSLIPPR